jgi:hypothetical protein
MTYVHRKRFTRKPKDILSLALRNLWPGEEIICTKRTYDAVKVRLEALSQSFGDRRIEITPDRGIIRKIRRVA